MSLPDCPYLEHTAPWDGGFCKAGVEPKVLVRDLAQCPVTMLAGASCCLALLITEHCPEGWR